MASWDGHNTKVLIALHRPYWIPDDPMYLPVQVGAVGKPGINRYQRDDVGENISAANPHYCELTALYWAWKNLPAADAPYLGLVHYRRHFKGTGERDVMTAADADALLCKAPVILPTKRNYVISSIEQHYGDTFDPVHIECLRAALEALRPTYVDTFNKRMAMTTGHMFNMMVMRRDLANAYCEGLFPVLELADAGIDYTGMTSFEERALGRMAERLLDTWIDKNAITYTECPVVSLEPVDWAKKGSAFLEARFLGKHYEESF